MKSLARQTNPAISPITADIDTLLRKYSMGYRVEYRKADSKADDCGKEAEKSAICKNGLSHAVNIIPNHGARNG